MFTIVDQVPARHRLSRNVGTAGRLLFGSVFVLAAVVAATPLLFVVGAVAVTSIGGRRFDASGIDGGVVVFVAVSSSISLVCWLLGSRLVRGHRRLAVFLRRFGFTPATEALSVAVTGGMGRGWRLVTLDDHRAPAIGVRRHTRVLFRLGVLAGVFVVGWLLWYAMKQLSDDGIMRITDKITSDAQSRAQAEGTSTFGAAIGAAVGAAVVIVVLSIVVLLPIGVFGASALFLSIGARSARRAEEMKAVVFADASAIEREARRVRRRSTKVFAPRLVVARVHDRIWQDVVARLVGMSSAVVVDVSGWSQNMVWELDLLERHGARWIAVGRRQQLELLRMDSSAVATAVRAHLAGRPVLAYSDGQSLKGFSLSLRHILDAVVDSS